jgi:hypothetical protein
MGENAFLGGLIAGFVYLIAGVRLGLCDLLACNRNLIWGITGVVWIAYSWGLLYQAAEFETNAVWSLTVDLANAVFEATGVALVWIIFFPPLFYQRWIAGAAPAAELEEA